MNATENMRERMSNQLRVDPRKSFGDKIARWHQINGAALEAFLGTPQDASRLWFAARNALNTNPALLNTDPASFCSALVMCAQMKLYPGPTGEVGLVPIGGQTQFWPMFKGLIKNGSRSGSVNHLQVLEVCERDEFDVAHGLKPKVHHKIDYRLTREDRGAVYAVYAVYDLGKRGVTFEVMSIEDINVIRDNSPSVKKGRASPWTSSFLTYLEMCKKTVLKRGFKDIDISPDFAHLIAVDNSVERHGKAIVKPVALDSVYDLEDGYAVDPAPFDGVIEPQDPAASPQPSIEHQERIEVEISQEAKVKDEVQIEQKGESASRPSVAITALDRLKARAQAEREAAALKNNKE